jgi:aspartate/methionine/tyrosine aminotransferase
MKEQQHSHLAGYAPAELENWYRENYFNNDIDISGSGVENYTFGHMRQVANVDFSALDGLKMSDAPTLGCLNIRSLLASRFADGNADKVIVTSGGNEALQLIARSILKSGDKIVTLGPCYHCHDMIAASIGCEVSKWNLSFAQNFALNLKDLDAVVTPDTKAIFLNFPHNPTGASISQSMLDDIVELARQNDIILVWDAVFSKLVYETDELIDPILNYEKAISIGTFSKAYGAPGLRFGWIISNCDIAQSCARQKDYSNLYVPALLEFIAAKMLENLDAFAKPRLEQAKVNRALVDSWVKQNQTLFNWVRPIGGVCSLLQLPQGTDDYAFCEGLLDAHGVLLVPGSCFAMPGFARLGFGGNTQKLKDGLKCIDAFVATL